MITLKDYFETVDFKITEGSRYMWTCYGPAAYRLDAWNGDQLGTNASIIFDTATHTVYEVTVYDYDKSAAYRMIDPDYIDQYNKEAKEREVDPDQAWDSVSYTDLEVVDDWVIKARAIMAGEEYDNRLLMPLELPDDQVFELMKLAHEQDMTLNQFVEHILQHYVGIKDQVKSGPAAMRASNKKHLAWKTL
jgi:hypothetical protein